MMKHIAISATSPRWAAARRLALAALPVLLGGFVLAPAATLRLFWYVVIPLLPATFFINPLLWRGLCPLATLNALGNELGTPRDLPPRTALALNVAGLALFYVLVPARHFAFNHDGMALAATVTGVGALAVTLGAMFSVRSAFCNALCPILPIELLYGTAPLYRTARNRCAVCTGCVPRGCIDLANHKAVPQRLGTARRTAQWLMTPYGMFFAALPGFILGYNHVQDGALRTAGVVYATTLGWALVSYLAVAGLVLTFRLTARVALTGIAAVSGGLYYWYTGAAIVKQFTAPAWMASGIRAVGLGLVVYWLVRGTRVASGDVRPVAGRHDQATHQSIG